MSNYAIINMKKMNSIKLKRLSKHNHREGKLSNENIDKSKKQENYHIAGFETDNLEKKVLDIIDKKIKSQVETVKKRKRKDENGNVIRIDEQKIIRDVVKYKADTSLVNEFLISASPEYMNSLSLEEQKRYFTEATNFLNDRYGNVAYAIVHMDETTPHLHVGVIPLVEDKQTNFKLSSNQIFGDTTELKALQEDFPNHLKLLGFQVERGLEGGQRKSLNALEYRLNETKKEVEIAELQLKAQRDLNGLKLPTPESKPHLIDKNKVIVNKDDFESFISTINQNMQSTLNIHLEAELKKKQAEHEKELYKKDKYLKEKLKKLKSEAYKEVEKEVEKIKRENAILKKDNETYSKEKVDQLYTEYNKLGKEYNKAIDDFNNLVVEYDKTKEELKKSNFIKQSYEDTLDFIKSRTKDQSLQNLISDILKSPKKIYDKIRDFSNSHTR